MTQPVQKAVLGALLTALGGFTLYAMAQPSPTVPARTATPDAHPYAAIYAEMAVEKAARDSAEAVSNWFAKHCVVSTVEPDRRCSFCQDTTIQGRRADVVAAVARLGGVAAVERGVTYCEKR